MGSTRDVRCFTVDQEGRVHIRRTRGRSRQRGRSADRVHGILDDLADMRLGGEGAGAGGDRRRTESYEQLLRENHSLQIENRTRAEQLASYASHVGELERQVRNLDLQNRELRRAVEDNTSETEAAKAKRKEQRRRNARLEAKVEQLTAALNRANDALADALDEIRRAKRENAELRRAWDGRETRMRDRADAGDDERARLQKEIDELRTALGYDRRRAY
ncbi:hypothetical protein VTK26DRAFT_3867 [Humicola hyalothermophila]